MASKRKMSQRQKHSKSTRGTQTEDISQVSSANTILIKNPPLRFKGLNPEEPTDVVDVVAGSNNNDGDYYDMDTRLTRDRLRAENEALRSQLNVQGEQINTLRAHIGVIRQHTITFILDQMDTLHMQRDTEV
ncbi:hypothetical protein LSH36_385g02062 [Paralvinella palmiformis]|uniref:Uncharacterized protein n=1 Tax=Paralvinella palmiformis TaxID=53620 RepID=A0AAD9MYV2_9ANNE|nr:hypothetical protein LSH36_385g02062 [Paralvinella palmiformis]